MCIFKHSNIIAAVCKLYNIPLSDTICFGDSNNDITMFEYAHTKVAMGNSTSKIKEMADFITDDIFDDGIEKALKKLNLI